MLDRRGVPIPSKVPTLANSGSGDVLKNPSHSAKSSKKRGTAKGTTPGEISTRASKKRKAARQGTTQQCHSLI
jgi:hypothetical protein